MADIVSGLASWGVAFLVAAGLVYEVIAAACSSPQTAEINAAARADTLMKWVYIGVGQAALFILLAAAIDRAHAWAILSGGTLAAVLMLAQYRHALNAGLADGRPGTESYR